MMPATGKCIPRGIRYLENVRLGGAAGSLTVTDGVVWLTHGDGRDDVVLVAGESAHFGSDAIAIASALGGSAAVIICNDVQLPLRNAA